MTNFIYNQKTLTPKIFRFVFVIALLIGFPTISGLIIKAQTTEPPRIVEVFEDENQAAKKRQVYSYRQEEQTTEKETVEQLQSKSQLMVTTGAARNLPGFTTNTLPRNDDSSTAAITLPFTINYYGVNFTQTYVNNNGNLTFTGQLSAYTPFALTTTNIPIIAAFFGDVDTRNTASGVVTYGVDTINGRQAFGVNYFNVGYFNTKANKLNTFQLILINRSDTGAGNFDIEFNYEQIQWETGDASGGINGLGGSSARVGYANGSTQPGTTYEQPGSAVNGALLDTNLSTGLIRNSLNSGGQIGRYVFPVRTGVVATAPHQFDFDGDNRDDLGVFRPTNDPNVPDFYVLRSSGQQFGYSWGVPNDIPVIADYDGDMKADIAVFRAGTWYVLRSSNFSILTAQHGTTGDIPLAADYDGDAKADITYWRPGAATVAGFSILQSTNGAIRNVVFGQTGDVPIAGNFDGDNIADPATYRNSASGNSNIFYYRGSLNNPSGAITFSQWGNTGDLQVAADYDGDGKIDPSVYRPSTQEWLIKQTATGAIVRRAFGVSSDIRVPADYDGDNRADIAIFRNGVWWINQSSNAVNRVVQYGITGDKPIQYGNLP